MPGKRGVKVTLTVQLWRKTRLGLGPQVPVLTTVNSAKAAVEVPSVTAAGAEAVPEAVGVRVTTTGAEVCPTVVLANVVWVGARAPARASRLRPRRASAHSRAQRTQPRVAPCCGKVLCLALRV